MVLSDEDTEHARVRRPEKDAPAAAFAVLLAGMWPLVTVSLCLLVNLEE